MLRRTLSAGITYLVNSIYMHCARCIAQSGSKNISIGVGGRLWGLFHYGIDEVSCWAYMITHAQYSSNFRRMSGFCEDIPFPDLCTPGGFGPFARLDWAVGSLFDS
jgi:hypothetical protein